MRKPHARSVLKTLPPDRQREIFDYLKGTNETPAHTLEETEAWLAASGVDTNRSSLSEFYHWYPLSLQLHQAASMGDAVKDLLREIPDLQLDEHQLSKAGQAIFEAQALQSGDSKLYVALRGLRQNDRELDLLEESGRTKAAHKERSLAQKDRDFALQREKFVVESCEKILKAARDPQMREVAESSELTNAEKIAAIRKAYFADIDSLEVELPE